MLHCRCSLLHLVAEAILCIGLPLESSTQRLATYLVPSPQVLSPEMYEFEKRVPFMSSVQIFSDTYAAVLRKTVEVDSGWLLFNPFTKELWYAILLTIFIFALNLVILQLSEEKLSRWQPRSTRYRAQKCCKALYHGFAAFLNCKEYEFVTWPGRILCTGILFFVLVTTATYTANLAGSPSRVLCCLACAGLLGHSDDIR